MTNGLWINALRCAHGYQVKLVAADLGSNPSVKRFFDKNIILFVFEAQLCK